MVCYMVIYTGDIYAAALYSTNFGKIPVSLQWYHMCSCVYIHSMCPKIHGYA